jgi:hypothetical protein
MSAHTPISGLTVQRGKRGEVPGTTKCPQRECFLGSRKFSSCDGNRPATPVDPNRAKTGIRRGIGRTVFTTSVQIQGRTGA